MTDDPKLLSKASTARVTREGGQTPINPGEWYWVQVEVEGGKVERHLGCVTRIGSNYAKVTFPGREDPQRGDSAVRIHFDQWDQETEPAPDAQEFIARQIEHYRNRTNLLLAEVRDLTARLAISATPAPDGETGAIVVSSGAQPIEDYKAALVLAKETTLPALFEQIKHSNSWMAGWMKAEMLPLKAQVWLLKPQIARVEARIFNVELYAGLVEQVVQIAEGAAAPPDMSVHLMQRRAYMDEECLAEYEVGGMEFEDIGEFDRWMARPANRDRLLPHPRCVLAMQVRRKDKDRPNIDCFITLQLLKNQDKYTFLYMRNGDQVFRLSTQIEFGEQLFPDITDMHYDGAIYANFFTGVREVIGEARYQGLLEDEAREDREHAAAKRAWREKVAALRAAGVPRDKHPHEPWRGHRVNVAKEYISVTPASVKYDDVMEFIAKRVEEHNRLVLILQGLFDRSPVFHPHPPTRLWEPDGFARALTLVYDNSRALVAGDAPDFEAYRARLNLSIRDGSITLGQDHVWAKLEAKKENQRQARDWRISRKSDYVVYRPYGNPGPGKFAKVQQIRGGRAKFTWRRERQYPAVPRSRWAPEPDPWVDTVVWAPLAELLHVDAYTPGDFRQFFADPRTRADYLEWAPLLLEAEEFKAGNRTVGDP